MSSDSTEIRTLTLEGHVGFDTLPDQLVRKQKAGGFSFNLLCVGETGIGKSTLLESLFDMPLGFHSSAYGYKTVELRTRTFDLEENGVRLKLAVAETAGYGEQQDMENSAKVIVGYIENQLELYLQEELKIKRQLHLYQDTRIHVCLYLLSPTGLKTLDMLTIQELCKMVNVIPVIAKSDMASKEELVRIKTKILSDLEANDVKLYEFPEDDESIEKINAPLNAAMPFAVVGSTDFVMRDGKTVRARQYPWGIVEVENASHCDFVMLREALMRQSIQDLRDKTHHIMYERYRQKRLVQLGLGDCDTGTALTKAYQEKMETHKQEILSSEGKMKKQFAIRVKEKEMELKRQEEALEAKISSQKLLHEEAMEKLDAEIQQLSQDLERLTTKKEQKEKPKNSKKEKSTDKPKK